jgi:hypothetical protein
MIELSRIELKRWVGAKGNLQTRFIPSAAVICSAEMKPARNHLICSPTHCVGLLQRTSQ